MGWTHDSRLIILFEDGEIFIHPLDNLFEPEIHNFGELCQQEGILESYITPNNIVVITFKFNILIFEIEDDQVTRLKEIKVPANTAITSLLFYELNYEINLVIGLSNEKVLQITRKGTKEIKLFDSQVVVKMDLSPNQKFFSCITNTGLVYVTTENFSNVLLQFDMKSSVIPEQLKWCGSDTILLYLKDIEKDGDVENLLLMIGRGNSFVNYYYGEEHLFITTETDGARIFSRNSCEFVSQVKPCQISIFKLGSVSPETILFESGNTFLEKNSKADLKIRKIMEDNQMHHAVTQCIFAAGFEFDTNIQRKLLRAASIGKSYCKTVEDSILNLNKFEEIKPIYCDPNLSHIHLHEPESTNFNHPLSIHNIFGQMSKLIRILNTIRDPDIGIPMTLPQFLHIGIDSLIEVLLKNKQYLISFEICKFMNLKQKNHVLISWACALIKSTRHDDDIYDMIQKKIDIELGKNQIRRSISYYEMANQASSAGRKNLAIRLLENELKPSKQVPLFLRMNENQTALNKAIESGDTSLVYSVLLKILSRKKYRLHQRKKSNSQTENLKFENLQKSMSENDIGFQQDLKLFKLLRGKPSAIDLLIGYWREQDHASLSILLRGLGLFSDVGLLKILENFSITKTLSTSDNLNDPHLKRLEEIEKSLDQLSVQNPENRLTDRDVVDKKILVLKEASTIFSAAKDSFHDKATNQQIKLLQKQLECEKITSQKFVGLSCSQTLFKLVTLNQTKRADKYRKELKISESKYWWIKIRALAHVKRFNELETLARSKSPIGYEPFALVCIENDAFNQASPFIEKISNSRRKAELYLKTGNYTRAIANAKQLNDPKFIDLIISKKRK
eukprot:Anaeramoba_ignava/a608996_92.p1 GENE.a608996_92~~a608996_92.p1  ORF type:complete len:847 (-),score=222.42 a608996_92:29-2569(-)